MAAAAVAPKQQAQQQPQQQTAPATLPLREKIQEYQRRLTGAFKQLGELNEESKKLNQGTPEFSRRRDEIRVQLDQLQQQTATLEEERKRLQEQQHDLAGRSAVGSPAGGGNSTADIDARIRAAERELMSKRMPPSQEAKIVQQISTLRQQRLKLEADAKAAAARTAQAQAQASPLRNRLEALKAELAACQHKRQDLNDSLTALLAKRKLVTAPLREIADKRDIVEREIVETRGHLNRMRDEVTRLQRQFDHDQQQQRQDRLAKRAEQKRLEALGHQKAKLLESLDQLEGEILSPAFIQTQRLLFYVQDLAKRLEPLAAGASAAAAEEEDDSTAGPPAELDGGLVLMAPKSPEVRHVTNKKQKKKKKGAAAVSPNAPLVHEVSILADFQRLHLPPPLSLRECPPLVETLTAKLADLKAKQSAQAEKVESEKKRLLSKISKIEAALEGKGDESPPKKMIDPVADGSDPDEEDIEEPGETAVSE